MQIETNFGTIWVDQSDIRQTRSLPYEPPEWFNSGDYDVIEILNYQYFHIMTYYESMKLSTILPSTNLVTSYRVFDIHRTTNVRGNVGRYLFDTEYNHLYAFNDTDSYMYFMMFI